MSKLFVDEIQPKTTGGVINIPTTIAFDVSKIKVSGTSYGSNQIQIFNHVTTNIGNAYDSSNGRFTAPVAGTYEFTHLGMGAGNTTGSSLGSGQTVQMFFRKNGSILTLAQNDYIEVYYDAYYMYFDTSIFNNFTGKLIGG